MVTVCLGEGVLENVSTIQVDPTVVTNPDAIKDPRPPNLVCFTLRAAVREGAFCGRQLAHQGSHRSERVFKKARQSQADTEF